MWQDVVHCIFCLITSRVVTMRRNYVDYNYLVVMRRELGNTYSSHICDSSCWAKTDYCVLCRTNTNDHLRTRSYASVTTIYMTFGSIFFKKTKNVSSSSSSSSCGSFCGDGSNSSSSSSSNNSPWVHEANISVVIGSASRSDSTLKPYLHILVFVVCFLVLT